MLLGNLKTVYETRDSQYFELLFNQNEFGFEFDPTDIERDPAIPSSWSWREERAATEKLFQDPDVVSIQLDFQSTDPEALREYEIDEYPPGTLRVIASNVELSVTIQNAGSEEPTTYEVTGDRALFFVVENPDRIVNCRPAWEIVGWRDEVQGQSENEPSARPTSWGGMKWYWSQMTIHR